MTNKPKNHKETKESQRGQRMITNPNKEEKNPKERVLGNERFLIKTLLFENSSTLLQAKIKLPTIHGIPPGSPGTGRRRRRRRRVPGVEPWGRWT